MKTSIATGLGMILFCSALAGRGSAGDEPKAADIFAKRILPIFKSPNPSSCTQCHLAGVDLKNYILPSHEKTFLSLRDQGMVNLETPDYAGVLADKYAKASDLPKEDVQKTGTEIWLRVTNPPAAWKESVVQMAVHGWDASKKAWSAEPVARTFATVETPRDGGKPFAHNTLFLLTPKRQEQAGTPPRGPASLPEGHYAVKIYLAPKARLEGDFQAMWKNPEFGGQAEIAGARWASGYPGCTVFDASQLGPKK